MRCVISFLQKSVPEVGKEELPSSTENLNYTQISTSNLLNETSCSAIGSSRSPSCTLDPLSFPCTAALPPQSYANPYPTPPPFGTTRLHPSDPNLHSRLSSINPYISPDTCPNINLNTLRR